MKTPRKRGNTIRQGRAKLRIIWQKKQLELQCQSKKLSKRELLIRSRFVSGPDDICEVVYEKVTLEEFANRKKYISEAERKRWRIKLGIPLD